MSASFKRFETIESVVQIDGLRATWHEPRGESVLDQIRSKIVVLDYKQTGFDHAEFEAFCARYLVERGYMVSDPPQRVDPFEGRTLSLEDVKQAWRER